MKYMNNVGLNRRSLCTTLKCHRLYLILEKAMDLCEKNIKALFSRFLFDCKSVS